MPESEMNPETQVAAEQSPLEVISYARPETPETERQIIRESVEVIIDDWESFFEKTSQNQENPWSDLLSFAQEKRASNQEQLNGLRERNPELTATLESINNCLGGVAQLIESQALLLKNKIALGQLPDVFAGEKVKNMPAGRLNQLSTECKTAEDLSKEILSIVLGCAQWQRDAIWSLVALDSMEFSGITKEGTSKRFVDVLSSALGSTAQQGLAGGGEKMAQTAMSGLFGPVKFAMLAKKAGYETSIAPTTWDVNGKIDMLLHLSEKDLVATQIKASTLPSQLGDFSMSSNSDDLKDKRHIRTFNTVTDYCHSLEEKSEWQGYKFQPAWASFNQVEPTTRSFRAVIGGHLNQGEIDQFRRFAKKVSHNENEFQNAT